MTLPEKKALQRLQRLTSLLAGSLCTGGRLPRGRLQGIAALGDSQTRLGARGCLGRTAQAESRQVQRTAARKR